MNDFEKELKECFLEEAAQMLADAERCFLALEGQPDDIGIVDQLFRLAHNLKGSGNAVGFRDLGAFTHSLESLLLKIKNRQLQVTKAIIDLLLKCNDHLQEWLSALRKDLGAVVDSASLITEIKSHGEATGSRIQSTISPAAQQPSGDVENQTSNSTPLMQDNESSHPSSSLKESLTSPPQTMTAAGRSAVQPKPVPASHSSPSSGGDESIRVNLSRLDKLLNCVGELVILHSVLKEQTNDAGLSALRKTIIQLGKATKSVQDVSMSLRMVPVKQAFQKMQRIVRDTSASLNKLVTLRTEGENTEVDKTMLEALSDPLVHLVRNAVDHGIESMEGRLDAGKSAEGLITLRAYHRGGNLVIEIRDDGAGLNPEKLRAKAVEKGILGTDSRLADAEAYQLIFAPGFSTKTEVTDISGRGVGMDVVKTNIDAIHGDIEIETEIGKGTCFRVTLPLTLAIIDGMIVRSQAGRFVVPLAHVHETIRPSESDVHHVTGIGRVFSLRGENLPLYYLDNLLRKPTKTPPVGHSTAIVVRGQRRSFAVMVDDIVGQAQVVIKQLGIEHRNLKGFSGSAILGDGRPALILELEDLSQRSAA